MTDAVPPPHRRGIFCNRTLNMRSIQAIGYDMDYTLIHYHVDEWERRAYTHAKQKMHQRGWPVADLEFDPALVVRGLVIDTELGNVVKANRFGYVKQAFHGTRPLAFEDQRRLYAREIIDLATPRFVFLNTLFSLSEGCLYSQLVDRLDARGLPEVLGYGDLYAEVKHGLDEAHLEGILKAEITAAPDRFVELDGDIPLALLDQQQAGKRLLLITNSEWEYTEAMMAYAFDRFLPKGTTWRALFDLVIAQARKPSFFSSLSPAFEIVDAEGRMRPTRQFEAGKAYVGGNAQMVEHLVGLTGDEILFVGDHLFADVHVSKDLLRWRTALVLRELEDDLAAEDEFAGRRAELEGLMEEKEVLEFTLSNTRLSLQRLRKGYGPPVGETKRELGSRITSLRKKLDRLDRRIAPLAGAASGVSHPHWGMLMRAGNEESLLARQVERYADIYLSRVANFLDHTPFVYLRSPRGTLAHDVDTGRG